PVVLCHQLPGRVEEREVRAAAAAVELTRPLERSERLLRALRIVAQHEALVRARLAGSLRARGGERVERARVRMGPVPLEPRAAEARVQVASRAGLVEEGPLVDRDERDVDDVAAAAQAQLDRLARAAVGPLRVLAVVRDSGVADRLDDVADLDPGG